MIERMRCFKKHAKNVIKKIDNWAQTDEFALTLEEKKRQKAVDYILENKEYSYSKGLLEKEKEDDYVQKLYTDNYRINLDLAVKNKKILEDVDFSGRYRRIEARKKAKMVEARLVGYDEEMKVLKDAGMDYLGLEEDRFKYPEGRKESNQTWFEYFFNVMKPGEMGYMSEEEINSNEWIKITTIEASMYFEDVLKLHFALQRGEDGLQVATRLDHDFYKVQSVYEEIQQLDG